MATTRHTPSHATREPETLNVADLRETLGISRERLGRVLDVSARTIQRWEDNDQLPSNRWVRGVLIELARIVDLGQEVFTPEGLQAVMTKPQPVFDNRSALELVENGEGERVFGQFALTYEGGLGI